MHLSDGAVRRGDIAGGVFVVFGFSGSSETIYPPHVLWQFLDVFGEPSAGDLEVPASGAVAAVGGIESEIKSGRLAGAGMDLVHKAERVCDSDGFEGLLFHEWKIGR